MTKLSSDAVVHLVADMCDRDDPYEGPVPHNVQRFAEFELVDYDLRRIRDLGDYQFDPSLAKEYAAMDPATMPPIIVDTVDHFIIDGYTRANAVLIRGETSIKAYVGVSPDADWEPMEGDAFRSPGP